MISLSIHLIFLLLSAVRCSVSGTVAAWIKAAAGQMQAFPEKSKVSGPCCRWKWSPTRPRQDLGSAGLVSPYHCEASASNPGVSRLLETLVSGFAGFAKTACPLNFLLTGIPAI